MGLGWALAGLSAAALSLGACAGAAPSALGAGKPAAGAEAERWDRAACLSGRYPTEIDDGALARAHLVDVRARGRGEWSPFAAARLEDERAAFRARCERWQLQARSGEGAP
jgi:hypothetical protein